MAGTLTRTYEPPIEIMELRERMTALEEGLAETARLLDEERHERHMAIRRLTVEVDIARQQARELVDQAIDDHLRQLREALQKAEATCRRD